MKDIVLYGVELKIFEDCHTFFAVDIELYSEDIGSVDQLTYCFVGYNEVGCDKAFAIADFYDFLTGFEGTVVGKFNDSATVEYYRDKTLLAEGFGCLLPNSVRGWAASLKSSIVFD